MADSKGENDAGSLGRGDLNLYRNRVCRGKLISNLSSFERLSNRSRLREDPSGQYDREDGSS
jgi:hypothetical protein